MECHSVVSLNHALTLPTKHRNNSRNYGTERHVMDIHHLLAICTTRDLLTKRRRHTKLRYRRRLKLAIASLDKQQHRVTVGLPRKPHSHGYGLPVGLWRDVQ